MDWWKLFALLVAVASIQIKADGPKKKIRIHLPQKVKHIHHHKKIYITNHPAASQYAPAYLPSADGAVAVSSNVALPSVANVVPLNSVELYDDRPQRLPGVSAAASKLLPLYRARGYYGPKPSEIEEQEYDISDPQDQDGYGSTDFSSPAYNANHPPKRVKIVKINDQPKKKVRKNKPKRVVVRNRPQPLPPVDEELPVSSFHEQFYSDLDGSATIRKIKKPPRVEKIIDGDTEHIHTYSEEHIHKLVFDDLPNIPGVVGVDGVPGMSALAGSPLSPFKNSQTLVAIPSDSFASLAAISPIGSPSHFGYGAYGARDVTHDHIFHDHGEIPANVDITKETLSLPPKVSYNSQGLRIGGNPPKRFKNKYGQRYKKPAKPTDFTYYESIYTANRPKKVKTGLQGPNFDATGESNIGDYRPISAFRFKDSSSVKTRSPTLYGKGANDYKLQQNGFPSPFTVSSTIVHDYKPKTYSGAASASGAIPKYKDPFINFKDTYASNFEYDTSASSSNVYTSEDKNDGVPYAQPDRKGKKKSLSTQNIRFGNQHLKYEEDLTGESNDAVPTALENFDQFDQSQAQSEAASPTPFTIKESSPAHPYYTAMAVKALQSEQSLPEASNNNYRFAEAPTPSTTPSSSVATTTSLPQMYMQNMDVTTTEANEYVDNRQANKFKETISPSINPDIERFFKELQTSDNDYRIRPTRHSEQMHSYDQMNNPTTVRGKLKYGDKISS